MFVNRASILVWDSWSIFLLRFLAVSWIRTLEAFSFLFSSNTYKLYPWKREQLVRGQTSEVIFWARITSTISFSTLWTRISLPLGLVLKLYFDDAIAFLVLKTEILNEWWNNVKQPNQWFNFVYVGLRKSEINLITATCQNTSHSCICRYTFTTLGLTQIILFSVVQHKIVGPGGHRVANLITYNWAGWAGSKKFSFCWNCSEVEDVFLPPKMYWKCRTQSLGASPSHPSRVVFRVSYQIWQKTIPT